MYCNLKIVVKPIKILQRFEMCVVKMLVVVLACGQFSNVEEKNKKFKNLNYNFANNNIFFKQNQNYLLQNV